MPSKDADQKLIDAAGAGGLAKVAELIARGADPLHLDSAALGAAAKTGHAECVKLLLPASHPVIGIDRLLEGAMILGHAKVAALLIGDEPRLLDGMDLSQCVSAAHENEHEELAELLLSIIDKRSSARPWRSSRQSTRHAPDSSKQPPSRWACYN